MSQGNLSSLRFSLEESVWFQKGQEVEELVSISLDPNITIQENEQYVTIQGTLELSGEYKRYQTEETEEEPVSAARFIHSVEEREEGICEFLHRFPVDISIPNNRIQSVYDIDVVVESFDYLFPERSCMKLTADLKISGLYGEQQKVPASDEELEYVQDDSFRDDYTPAEEEDDEAEKATELKETDDLGKEIELKKADEVFEEREEELQFLSRFSPFVDSEEEKKEENVYETFEAEARKQPEAELNQQPVHEQEASPALIELTPASENAEKAPEEVTVESGVFTPEISFSVQRKEAPAPQAAELFENNQVEEIAEETETEELEVKQEKEPVLEEADESESSPEQVETKKKKLSKKKSLSITEFLARKEEERQAKLKVCIVQQGETLDQLAERYDITIAQLLRVNHLEANQDVYEGQVLYIPVAVKQK
ncbi:stage VI sporulation protein D [Bacillus methanolicus PB1]|uniref:Stage VI sporulation protein D n=1 Tax=Bacillus methanolicus PB1 TaxID=997296 RepID=I3DXT9_BACMT|nr:stage VI sporulation protein D [Bacillus methanolicus]EIJ79060.1 stage VI sporulation protein D [Bacillus methanolicus PB1]